VTKAYITRVGEGPFPSEDRGSDGLEMVNRGKEYGATTGRQRRCGWFDAVIGRYAARVNGVTDFVLTKLDVLTGLDSIKVCTRYRGEDGAEFDHFPFHQTVLHHATGEYIELPGWSEDISDARSEDELPDNARAYLRFMEEFIGVPIVLISVGPGREQTMWTDAGRETAPGRAVAA